MRHLVSATSVRCVAAIAAGAVLALALPTTALADSQEAETTDAAEAEAMAGSETPDVFAAETEAELDATATGDLSSIAVPGEFSEPPERSAIDLWDDQNKWSYGTGYLFPLTRELDESGLPEVLQPVAMVLTVPLDVVALPAGALAGLFGS